MNINKTNINMLKLLGIDIIKALELGYSQLLDLPLKIIPFQNEDGELIIAPTNENNYFLDYCKYLRSTEKGNTNCQMTYDNIKRMILAKPDTSMGWIQCWAGLSHFFTPIYYELDVLGMIVGGSIHFENQSHPPLNIIEMLSDVELSAEIFDKLRSTIRVFNHSDASFILGRVFSIRDQISDLLTRINRQNEIKSISEYLSEFRLKTVLVLGKDTDKELQLLYDISNILTQKEYKPILVKEQPDLFDQSNEDKVRSFADASRFVILENSYPAGQIAECKILSTNRIVTLFLREKNTGSSFMVTDYSKDFDFMEEFTYESNDPGSLINAIENGICWAESKINERREYFNEVYPWRSKNT